MRPNGTLLGIRWGPISAIGPQPRRLHENELWVGTPTAPWRSPKLPRTLLAGDPRRTLFRTLLRRAEGVPVEFADRETGIVEEVVFPVLGLDFWPAELVVAIPERRLRGPLELVRLRVPVARIRRIDVRDPRIVVAAGSRELLAPGSGRGNERNAAHHLPARGGRRHDAATARRLLPQRPRRGAGTVGSR